jgi:endonuclease/exonuclease/phosphatase family metal-dependent hydrolase
MRPSIRASVLILALATSLGACVTPGEPPEQQSVSAVSINLLHGILCGDENCRLEERVDLLADWVTERGCPDVVALQEVWEPTAEFLEPHLDTMCDFPYEMISGGDTWGVDDELLLSRYPARETQLVMLEGDFRHVLHAEVEHPLGELDLFVTHLASGADGGGEPCVDCDEACVDAGAETLRDCQAVQVGGVVRLETEEFGLVMGDLNDPADSDLYRRYDELGWLDTYLEAGNLECDPDTGIGCTSGREDETIDELEMPDLNLDERIDYIFLTGSHAAGNCAIDGPDDDDDDGQATRLFADLPNPFAESCGPDPDAICWPSDHVGVQVDMDCYPIWYEPFIPPMFTP